jgi:molybdopterin-binding protein
MIWSMYNIQNDFKKRVKLIISGTANTAVLVVEEAGVPGENHRP